MRRLTLLFLLLLSSCFAATARAHDMGSMRVDVFMKHGGGFSMTILADQDHIPSAMRKDFAAALVANTSLDFDGTAIPLPAYRSIEPVTDGGVPTSKIRIEFAGSAPAGASKLIFLTRLKLPEYYVVVHQDAETPEQSQWVEGGSPSRPFELQTPVVSDSAPVLLARYTWLGFTHIIPEGFDHILFVLGLCLLAANLKQLLSQVTAFTVAHSITLALSLTGAFSLPSHIVEPLIAVSIAYVAIENLFAKEFHIFRVAVVFGFGLVHGMGFAGVLKEVGIPSEHLWTALLGFNVGVELGQLTVILLAYIAVGLWFRRKSWYRVRVVLPASACIATFALCLTAERVLWP